MVVVSAVSILILATLIGAAYSNWAKIKATFNEDAKAANQRSTKTENKEPEIDTKQYTKAESGNYDIVFALDSWIGGTPAIYALDKGFDKKYSLKVGIENLRDEKTKMLGLKEGKFQAIEIALPVFLNMQKEYHECGIIAAITDFSYGSDGIISKSEIKDLSEIKGKKVAYLSDGISKYSLAQFLNKANLKYKDVIPVEKASFEDLIEEINSGNIDAVVASDQSLFTINRKMDHMKPLLSSRDIPDFMPTVLVINSDFAQKEPNKVNDFLKMWFDSVDDIIKNSDKSFLDILTASKKYPDIYGEVTEDDVKQSLAGIKLMSLNGNFNYFGIDGKDAKLANIIKDTESIIQNSGDAPQEINISKILDGSFLESIFKGTRKHDGSGTP
jgi:NitT/TauT family transport system substrate-binding protein